MNNKNNVGNTDLASWKREGIFSLKLNRFKSSVLIPIVATLISTVTIAQNPGIGGTRANFEVDAQFYSNQIPSAAGFWTGANYTPSITSYGDDWSKGSAGNAVLKQSGGVSIPGTTTDGSAIWQVDGNWGNSSAYPEGKSFAGMSNKNGDDIRQGVKPYSLQLGGTGPQKNDITQTFLHTRMSGSDLWLFFGAETRATNGNSYIDFEYNQNGVTVSASQLYGPANSTTDHIVNGRTVNDFILVVNYTGGGNRPVVGIRKWLATGQWSAELALNNTISLMTTNANTISPVAPNKGFTVDGAYTNTTIPLQFVEGGVNISQVPGLEALNLCAPNATVTVKTRSSSSFTAELKDLDVLHFSLRPGPSISTTVIQPSCSRTLGEVKISSLGAGFEYSFDGGATYGADSVATFAAGAGYNARARAIGGGCLSNVDSCLSEADAANTRIIHDVMDEPVKLKMANELNIYPNPNTGVSKLEFTVAQEGKALINVYDINGKLVKQLYNEAVKAGESHSIIIDGSTLPSGMYFTRLVIGDKIIQSQKFIIQR